MPALININRPKSFWEAQAKAAREKVEEEQNNKVEGLTKGKKAILALASGGTNGKKPLKHT